MPAVLGADPDVTVSDWDDDDGQVTRAPGWIYDAPMRDMVNTFAYHPRMRMDQRCNDDDKTVVARWVNRKRKQGYTDDQIKRAINRFFQSFASEYGEPAFAIASNTLQDRIFDLEDRITSDDPLTDWLLKGMPDDGPLDDCRGTRSLILMRGGKAVRMYPDAVIKILALPSRTRWKERLLVSLNLIIDWNLGQEVNSGMLMSAQDDIDYLDPPSELLSKVCGGMREEHKSMHEAIARHQYRSKSARTD
jgi:hypothetical protein